MSKIHVETERIVEAGPKAVYEVISDYKDKRPQILTPNFLDYKVERGGKGAGTVVSYRLHAARRERPYEMRVEEPVKGQVLTEKDTRSSLVTMWTLTPQDDGRQTRVRVTSEWEGSKGVGGFFERTFAPLGLRSIYNTILSQLSSVATTTSISENTIPALDTAPDADANNAAWRLGLFFLLFGAVVAAAVVAWYLQRQRNNA